MDKSIFEIPVITSDILPKGKTILISKDDKDSFIQMLDWDIRPELKEFMLACEAELKRHDAIKGDSWKNMPIGDLYNLLMGNMKLYWLNDPRDNKSDDLVDIANLAMMLWYRS